MKGVNLGGWLVIEKWMTPSLFAGSNARNEFELSRGAQGRERIARHHKTFITEGDLEWMKQQGIEILRVPFGHWIFGDDERYIEAIERLDWLMDTSLSLGLKVLLDLHAAPEAQNRAAHSGSGNTMTDEYSTKWLNNKSAQNRTIEVLTRVAKRYNHLPHLWGIELLNEPAVDMFGLKLAWFYRRAYKAVITVARPGTRIIFSDGYAPLRLTNCLWLARKRDYPLAMDTHVYQVFGERNKKRSFDQHIAQLAWVRRLLGLLRLQQPVIIGEWSTMLPLKTTPEETQEYANAQLQAFDGCLAQFYWSYKTEQDGRWNYRDLADRELIQ
jgi:glucan 1,3-beta-glucosidase